MKSSVGVIGLGAMGRGMARASKFPLPRSSAAHPMFMQASTAGFAKEDDSVVIKIFPDIELPKKELKP